MSNHQLRDAARGDVLRAGRFRHVGRVAAGLAVLVVLAAVAFAAGSVATPTGLRWVTGAVLVVLVASAWLLCAHAGGHALFVPLPALALAVVWALTVPGHNHAAAWWLVAMSAAAAGVGGMIGAAALSQRWKAASTPTATLRGASGTAVTPLTPAGVVRVAGESWSAVSLSGPLAAGVPVHVARADGVRLEVWSEAGTVPDQRSLESADEQQKEERQ